jgi:tetratricopeptide (TPR) repeat protein
MKIVLFLFISAISFNSFSQNNKFDSLNLALNNSKSDTTKIRLYHELYILTSHIRYINLGFKLSIKNNYQHGISVFYRDYGRQYFFSSKKDKALEYLNKAVKIALKINGKKTLVSCYKYIGYIYAMNDPFLAQVYYVKSIKLARELNDFIGESYALSAIGNIYEGMIIKKGNFKIALSYYLKSLKIREKYGDFKNI